MASYATLDSLIKVGRRPKVNVSHLFAVGQTVKIFRAHPRPKGWEMICEAVISEIPKDARGYETNEILFADPLPKEVKRGDLVILGDLPDLPA